MHEPSHQDRSPRPRPAGCSRGAALLELAVVVPVLMFLFLGGFELTRAVYTRGALIGFAREISVEAFRTAVGLNNATAAAKLQQAIDTTWAVFNREFPGATIRLRLVKYGVRHPAPPYPNSTVAWNLVGDVVKHGSGVNPSERISRLGAIDANGNSLLMDDYFRPTTPAELPRRDVVLANHEYYLLGEFYIPYGSIIPGLSNALGFSGGVMYVRLEY